jgi:hypothetical protein
MFLYLWEIDRAAVGGVMDFDRIRAPGLPGSPPIEVKLDVPRSCAGPAGCSIAATIASLNVARQMKDNGGAVSGKDIDYAGFCFREGLDALADMWLSPRPARARCVSIGRSMPCRCSRPAGPRRW